MSLTPAHSQPPAAAPSGKHVLDGAPLRIEAVHKSFGSNHVLKGVSLEVRGGELLVLLGGNGCGKSTLLRCAIRLIDPDSGSSMLNGRDLAELRGRELRRARADAAVIFQQIALVKRRNAFENVCCGALGRMSTGRSLLTSSFPHEVRDRAAIALARVGLLDRAWQRAGTLSGGQAQRVAIARAYCQQASVILADEPVSALDPRAAEEVLSLLADLAHSDGLAVVCVLHQPELALRHADRIAGMKLGEITFDKPAAEVSSDEIEGLYQHLRQT